MAPAIETEPPLTEEPFNLVSLTAMGRADRLRLTERASTAVLVALGLMALGFGGLVYMTDRDGVHATLIPVIPALAGAQLFGPIGLWLPSLVHPFAFSLFTAAALPVGSAWRYGACATWFALDATFELGQHPAISRGLGAAIENLLGHTGFGRTLADYFVGGAFDRSDLVAAAMGALAAAGPLLVAQRLVEKGHGN